MNKKRWEKHRKKVARKIKDESLVEVKAFFRKLDLCKAFNELIRIHQTGTLEELAKKNGVKVKKAMQILVYMIEELKCPIEYDSLLKTYYYTSKGELMIGFYPNKTVTRFIPTNIRPNQ